MAFRHHRSWQSRWSTVRVPGLGAARILAIALFAALLAAAVSTVRDSSAIADHRPRAAAVSPSLPSDLRQLQEWLDARDHDDAAKPTEARLAYRRGMLAWRAHEEGKAITLLRGAAALDPSYAAPHLTLVGWFLLRDPSQALQCGAAALDRLRRSFLLQIELAGTALFYGIHALFFGLLAAGLILVGRHQRELRHMWRERLGAVVSDRSARVWEWLLLLLPFALGIGLAVPVLVMFAMLWPLLRMRERAVFLGLVLIVGIAPLVPRLMGRLALPFRSGAAPFYDVQELENAPYTPERHAEIRAMAAQHPSDPFLQFGLAWLARRAGDLSGAEAAYRNALEQWPDNDRVLNNLGNLLAMQSRFDEALALYHKATTRDGRNAAAYFNSSQVAMRRFDYRAATEAAGKASAIDFEMVQTYQAKTGDELPLVDQWLAPALFWQVLFDLPERTIPPAVPPAWRATMEMSGWPFAGLALALTALAFVLGLWWHRKLPVRSCSNCATPVCRRCAHRQRELALCPTCASVAARAESPEFGRVLLLQQRRKVVRLRAILSTTLAALVPGLGLVVSRRIFYALGLLMIASLLTSSSLQIRAPFPLGQELQDPQGALWSAAISWLLLYVLSIVGFLGRSPEAEPAAAKPAPSSRGVFPENAARAA